MAQYEVFRCCENFSCNWFQKLLGYSGDELNGTTNCSKKLQIFEAVKANYKYLKWLKQITVAATNCNRLQWNIMGYSGLQ